MVEANGVECTWQCRRTCLDEAAEYSFSGPIFKGQRSRWNGEDKVRGVEGCEAEGSDSIGKGS